MTVIDALQVVNNTLSLRLAECTLAPEFLCVVQRKRVQRPKCVYDGSVGQHIIGHNSRVVHEAENIYKRSK